jgi:hypothetical protein
MTAKDGSINRHHRVPMNRGKDSSRPAAFARRDEAIEPVGTALEVVVSPNESVGLCPLHRVGQSVCLSRAALWVSRNEYLDVLWCVAASDRVLLRVTDDQQLIPRSQLVGQLFTDISPLDCGKNHRRGVSFRCSVRVSPSMLASDRIRDNKLLDTENGSLKELQVCQSAGRGEAQTDLSRRTSKPEG